MLADRGVPRKLVYLFSALFLVIFLATLSHRYDVKIPTARFRTKASPDASFPQAHVRSWRRIAELLEKHKPTAKSPERLDNAQTVGFEKDVDYERPKLLRMPAEDIEQMRQAHQSFVADISTPEAGTLLAYTPGSKGIVTTAGGAYLPVAVISIRMLRRTGSELPIEVFLMSNDEYESYPCEVVLPSLNAKCIVITDISRTAPLSVDTSHYALKAFALVMSSFDETLFLDADCFPLHDPTELLTSEPFASKGFVTWPDFWRTTHSPQYFEISAQTPAKPSLRQSSESGEILLRKSTHGRALLLALYYNVYGQSHYYALLSQGALGEGDKETFLAAAIRLGRPFHAVAHRVGAIGHWYDNNLHGSAMIQYDPRVDYANALRPSEKPTAVPQPFFVHANYPKFNPGSVFHSDVNPTVSPSGEPWLPWTDGKDTVASLGENVQRHFWEEIRWTACELETHFRSWADKHGVCKNTTEYFDAVFKGP